jgi:SAM-dependent methyltransferase
MSSPASRIIPLYDRHARRWDARRGDSAVLEQGWLERFLALMPASPAVLDLGCGSGQPIAWWLVERGCAVTGVDAAPAMIGLCRERMPAQAWVVADMRLLNLGRRFDGLIAWDSFFHLAPDDQRRMFAVFAAHAAPGAALLFTSGPAQGEAIGEFEGEPLYHASLAPDEYRALLAGAGFTVQAFVPEDPACGQHTVWLAQRVAGPAPLAESAPARTSC